jgi:hypothetical protein
LPPWNHKASCCVGFHMLQEMADKVGKVWGLGFIEL